MAYNKNLNISPNNVVNISGSLIRLTGSLTGTQISGTMAQFTTVSASVVSASQYIGLNLTASVISGSELNIDYIDFAPQATEPAYQLGRVFYDGSGSLAAYTDIEDVKINLGQELMLRVHNETGAPINKGKVVRITSTISSTDTPRIVTASWDGDPSSASTLGVVVKNINNTEEGYVILNGILLGINLTGLTAGQILYLSSSGDFTTTKPVQPKHEVRVGQVVRPTSNGTMFVRIQNGYELDEIHDVLITSKQNGDLLAWNSSDSLWKNTKTLSGSYTLSGSLTSNGTITALSLVETSTRKIKKDIYSMQSQIENIKKLNPVNYVRILDNKQEFGFIAEELKEVYPEFVIGDGVNYPKMVSILVSAVQELTQKIEKQQDEIELIKNKKKTTRGKK